MAETLTMVWFGKAVGNGFGGETAGESTMFVDLLTDTIKFAWVNALPNKDTAETWADLVSTEVSGTGWAAGGITLASKTWTYDSANDRMIFDAADISQSGVTISGATHGVIYKSTGVNSTSPLIAFGTLSATINASNVPVNVVWNATGILAATA